ncbi:MAG: hypothetical protein H6696_14145 [Deferribacteres bacterium]|nr:hypothetical protein [candidate division KSB1 bacterium]MCB9503069.1 hypothetical protein [Deferribacteres bacterium]
MQEEQNKKIKKVLWIIILIVLFFTAYHFEYEKCGSQVLYGPEFGDSYLIEKISCHRTWDAGWIQIFNVWSETYLTQNVSTYVLNETSVLDLSILPEGDRYGDAYTSQNGWVKILKNGSLKFVDIQSEEYSNIKKHEKVFNETSKVASDYRIKYPFHMFSIIYPKSLGSLLDMDK